MGTRRSSHDLIGSRLTTAAPQAPFFGGWLAVVPVVFLVAACTSTTAPTTSDSAPVVSPAASVSTTTSENAGPVVAGPVDLCPRGMAWDTGVAYVADCFIVSVTFEPTVEGWRSRGVGAEWIEGTWIDPETSTPSVHFALLAYESSKAPEEVIASIVDIDGVNATSEIQSALVAGRTGLQVDVITDPAPANNHTHGRRGGCSTDFDHALDLSLFSPGYILMDRIGFSSFGSVYGLGACFAFRIWAIEVDGFTLTLIVAAPHSDELEPAASSVQSLFDAAVLGSS